VRDQAYSGLKDQNRLANLAIDETRGSVMMYDTDLAEIYYHSTCGGLLEASENVWQDAILPYMNVRQDALGDQFACQSSPVFRWQQTFTLSEIDSLFKVKYNFSQLDHPVTDTTKVTMTIKPLQRSSGGRVQTISVVYGDTAITLEGLEIRHFFSKKGRSLKSTMFTMKAESDSLLIIEGGGFGHGAGMCQYGALQMSEQGFKFYDILVNKYFRGTHLKKVY
jgi:stage II sporulation protein D